MGTFTEANRKDLLTSGFVADEQFIPCSTEDSLLSVQLNDIHNYLAENILKKVDLASMLVSLEARVPFLDYRLVPLVLSLPDKYKIRCLTTKWFLKKIADKYLPRQIVHRTKRGFTVPVSSWIRSSDLIKEFLAGKRYYESGPVNYARAQQLFDEHLSRKRDNARELWLIFVFNYWQSKQVSRA
jgi:asparagine synthase (glutamine-hydrolysing)